MENEPISASSPETLSSDLPQASTLPLSTSLWKRLIRCNPFYLISAVLLIYGVYRASIDPHFLSTETRQVIFNFGSLELYGVMLVVTAIFLSRRLIWYDATLLVFLENVLVLVPFILISHAVFLDSGLASTMSLLACVLVTAKFTAFKALFKNLNLPKDVLFLGALILIANTAIPLVFRKGLDTDNELWTVRSQYCWFILLPLLVASGHILQPLRTVDDQPDEHRKAWIPLTTFLLWISGSAAHLYSVGYVDDQKFELAKFSVLLWSISWLLCAKITLAVSRFTRYAPELMLALPIAASLLAGKRPGLSIALNILNAAIFVVLCIRVRSIRLPALFGGISMFLALLSVPDDWITPYVAHYSKPALIFVLANAALIVAALRMRTAKWAFIGAICLASLFAAASHKLMFAHHYAIQFACAFLLIHSLFWKGPLEKGSRFLLILASGIWAFDSLSLVGAGGLFMRALPFITAGPLLALALWHRNSILPIACAAIVILITPTAQVFSLTQNAPIGVLALAGSFLLFGIGTAFATWKRRFPDYPKGMGRVSAPDRPT
jgi:hypothetical protein